MIGRGLLAGQAFFIYLKFKAMNSEVLNFIYERQIRIEAYHYMIDRLESDNKIAVNGHRETNLEKIKILKRWIDISEDQIRNISSPALIAVMEHFNKTLEDLKGSSREYPLPIARQLFCYISVTKEKRTLKATADMINRKYPYVIRNRNKIEWEIENVRHISKHYKALISAL